MQFKEKNMQRYMFLAVRTQPMTYFPNRCLDPLIRPGHTLMTGLLDFRIPAAL